MKTIRNIFLTLAVFVTGLFTSCDYLDIVPDEKESEKDAFEDTNAALRFLYSCYAYLPPCRSGTESLDFMTGDEVITAFEHEKFANFPNGNYTASSTGISYWKDFFIGLRQCYIFLNGIDQTPKLSETNKKDYVAQVKFLIAYYHYLLVRCYGPVILIKQEPSMADKLMERQPFDDCVKYVCDLFDEAAADLPNSRPDRQYGLATKIAAKSLKARMLLYAASPLFNGNSQFYAKFTSKDGTPLMPLSYDAKKWEKARDAYKEAIQLAEANGHALYYTDDYDNGNQWPADPVQHRLRYNIMEAGNKEIIWADSRDENAYGIQNKSLPYVEASAWNGVAPTWAMLNRFYTKNGLPVDVDPEFKNKNMLEVVTVNEDQADQAEPGQKTIRFNLDREPRFYAWVAFQGGYFEVLSAQDNGAYSAGTGLGKGYISESNRTGKILCDFVLGGNCARGTVSGNQKNLRTNNYSPSGYLNKKGVDPGYAISTSLQSPLQYPWPLVRLGELYLGYAECLVETNDLPNAKIYINKIRERAGIPTVEKAWGSIGVTLDQAKLRDIVRQERMVELYLENQNFWDLRRWLMAEKYFNVKAKGLNIEATTIDEFAQLQEIIFERKFVSPTQYLLPIPIEDINKDDKLVQNPGY